MKTYSITVDGIYHGITEQSNILGLVEFAVNYVTKRLGRTWGYYYYDSQHKEMVVGYLVGKEKCYKFMDIKEIEVL